MSRHLSAAPWWFVVLVVLALLPVFSTPALLAACHAGDSVTRTYVMLYPVAVVASAYYSLVSYNTRPLLAWIMLIFMALIDASVFFLVLGQG